MLLAARWLVASRFAPAIPSRDSSDLPRRSVCAACAAAGVPIDDPGTARLYLHALGQLAASRMIEEIS